MAELRFLGYLAEAAGSQAKEVILEKPTRLGEIVALPFPEERIIILIDQKVGSFDSFIKNENTVVFMPVVSGG
jgi:molybdopterin converting factor small subunit